VSEVGTCCFGIAAVWLVFYHVLRAALIAKKAKVKGQVIGSRTASYFWPSATIREFVAVLV